MDTHLKTLSDELYLVNTHVGRITRRQARLGGFMKSPSPSFKASKDDDDDFDDDDNAKDGDASSPSDDKMST